MGNAAKSLYKEGLQSIICSFEHYNSLVKSFLVINTSHTRKHAAKLSEIKNNTFIQLNVSPNQKHHRPLFQPHRRRFPPFGNGFGLHKLRRKRQIGGDAEFGIGL